MSNAFGTSHLKAVVMEVVVPELFGVWLRLLTRKEELRLMLVI